MVLTEGVIVKLWISITLQRVVIRNVLLTRQPLQAHVAYGKLGGQHMQFFISKTLHSVQAGHREGERCSLLAREAASCRPEAAGGAHCET